MKEIRLGNTDNQGVSSAVEQLRVWSRAARRQGEAISRAAAAAEVIAIVWENLDQRTREKLEHDAIVREKLRHLMGYYGFNCS